MNKANNYCCQGSLKDLEQNRGVNKEIITSRLRQLNRLIHAIHKVIHRLLAHPFTGWHRLMIVGNICATRSICWGVFSLPKERRTSALAFSRLTPIASTTCDGSSEPTEQADPLDAQIPSISSPANNPILSHLSTVNANVLFKDPIEGLNISTPSIDPSFLCSLEIPSSTVGLRKTGGQENFLRAVTRPATAARFYVPARRSFS